MRSKQQALNEGELPVFLKHEQFMDVCIEVRFIQKRADGGFKAYGGCWNLGQSALSFPIGIETKISVSADEVVNWKQCTDGAPDLRTAEWKEVAL